MRLSEKAYHLIKQRIVTLELAPLSVIDERVLGEELELGRTPIREALHRLSAEGLVNIAPRLSAEGLVNIAPRRGMFVADISITDLARIFEVRIVLEQLCARLAAQRISQEQLVQMEVALRGLEELPAGEARDLMAIDERFHRLLYEAADNEFLMDTLNRLHALSMRLWHLVLNRLTDVQSAVGQHRQIAAAVGAGDGAKAAELIRQHIEEFQRSIKAAL
jgi:DNA-binding GntR family transcriptional regulator